MLQRVAKEVALYGGCVADLGKGVLRWPDRLNQETASVGGYRLYPPHRAGVLLKREFSDYSFQAAQDYVGGAIAKFRGGRRASRSIWSKFTPNLLEADFRLRSQGKSQASQYKARQASSTRLMAPRNPNTAGCNMRAGPKFPGPHLLGLDLHMDGAKKPSMGQTPQRRGRRAVGEPSG